MNKTIHQDAAELRNLSEQEWQRIRVNNAINSLDDIFRRFADAETKRFTQSQNQ